MHHLRETDGGHWSIVDEHANIVLCGSLTQCEEWLDHAENLSATQTSPVIEPAQVTPFFVRFWRHCFGTREHSTPLS